jgi:hypothetical protein
MAVATVEYSSYESRLLEDIRQEMEEPTRTGFVSRVFHLNRNERKLQDIRERLDNAYRDFMVCVTCHTALTFTLNIASRRPLHYGSRHSIAKHGLRCRR